MGFVNAVPPSEPTETRVALDGPTIGAARCGQGFPGGSGPS